MDQGWVVAESMVVGKEEGTREGDTPGRMDADSNYHNRKMGRTFFCFFKVKIEILKNFYLIFEISKIMATNTSNTTSSIPKTKKYLPLDLKDTGFRMSYTNPKAVAESQKAKYEDVTMTCTRCHTKHRALGWLAQDIRDGKREADLLPQSCHICRAADAYYDPDLEEQQASDVYSMMCGSPLEYQQAMHTVHEKIQIKLMERQHRLNAGYKFSRMVELVGDD
jgi:hypothetical protein